MSDQILTVKEVADYLKINERTVYRMATGDKIPAFKVGASPQTYRTGKMDQGSAQ